MVIRDDTSKLKEKKRNVIIRFGGLAMRDILLGLLATCESARAVCILLDIKWNTLNRWLAKEHIHVQHRHIMIPLDAVTNEPLTVPPAALASVEEIIAQEQRAKGGG